VNIAYAMFDIDGAIYMLDMWSCVHMVLCACWIYSVVYRRCYVHVGYVMLYVACTCGVMYIWCCVHDYAIGVVNMWCCVHVVHMVLCAGDVVYMSCIWYCVHVVSCTCHACGAMYVYHFVHNIHVLQCICGIVCTLYRC